MYVTISGTGSARVIQFVEQHRIPKTNKKKTVVIKTIGNYEDMVADDPEVIEKLKIEAKRLTEEKKAKNKPITLEVSRHPIASPSDTTPSFHFGHAAIKSLWNNLELDNFFKSNCKKKNQKNLIEAIFSVVMHRMMDPKSIHYSYLDLPHFAGITQHHKDLYYNLLETFSIHKDQLIDHLCNQFEKKTNRTGPVAYYDVTTFRFESVNAGELRLFGYSKDNKQNEVQVVMGLLLDNQGLPISYELFPGNTMDQSTLTKAVENLKARYKMDKIVVVADRGLNGKDNLAYLVDQNHDFVISYTLKKAPQFLKNMALDHKGWEITKMDDQGEILSKQKVINHQLTVKVELSEKEKASLPPRRGRPKKYKEIEIPVRIHITWNAKRAHKDREDRKKVLKKVQDMLDQPSKINSSLKRGRNQYLTLETDLNTVHLDEERIAYQEQFDGLYAIITNQLGYETEEVTNIYGGLWKIEESFRVMKTDLQTRPVYVWLDEHVQGHFALCFLSFSLMRYAQYLIHKKTDQFHSAQKLQRALNEPTVLVQGNYPIVTVTPTDIPVEYFDLMESLNMPGLTTNMTLQEFKKATSLDLSKNFI